jgi:hypothetical protein
MWKSPGRVEAFLDALLAALLVPPALWLLTAFGLFSLSSLTGTFLLISLILLAVDLAIKKSLQPSGFVIFPGSLRT